jgi:outer membrane protein, heavy metal efflux system
MAELNVQGARDSFDTYDKQLRLNETRYKNGAINGLELSRVEQAQLEASQAIDAAESGRKQAVASLMFLLGLRSAIPDVTLTTDINYADVTRLKDATVESLHELALQNRTDVKIATANLGQAQTQLRQAKRSRLPDVQLQLGYSELCNSVSCSSEPGFFAGLQGNVPLLYQQQGEIRRAESGTFVAERTLDKTKAQVLSEVTQAYAGYGAAKSQVQRMESKLLEQAKRSRDLAQIMYRKGAASLIDFMDAQRAYVAAVLEYHQDLANYWSTVYQLEAVTATSLR